MTTFVRVITNKTSDMVLNYIWIAFFLIAFVTALMRLVFLGDTRVSRNYQLYFQFLQNRF